MFDKTSYVDYYLPPQRPYHKTRKPRLAQWDDPDVVWPPRMAKANKERGRQLIKVLENEEKAKYEAIKPYRYPDFRSGDLIEFHNLHSLSEGRGNTY
jgi:ribosomal protein L19